MPARPVSVVITNYNYGRFLSEAIESALDQDHEPIEVVVVDDGSTDGSADVIRAFGGRVSALFQDQGGQGAAINAGFAACRGDVVVFLDADDVLLPTAIGRAAAMMAGASKTHWPLLVVDEGGRPTGARVPTDALPAGDLRPWLLDEGPGVVPFPPTSGNSWGRPFLERVLPMPAGRYRVSPDAYLAALAPLYGTVEADTEPHGLYRLHPTSNYMALSFKDRLALGLAQYDATCEAVGEHCRRLGLVADLHRWEEASWFHRLHRAQNELDGVVRGHVVALVDDDQWGVDGSVGWTPVPFPERDGVWWGPPADDDAALAELDRVIEAGATRLVVAWPASWWLDHYTGFARRLREAFPCLLENERVTVFDLARPVGLREPVVSSPRRARDGLIAPKMHHDQIDTDSALVRLLLEAQQPRWADLPIEPVASAGTDNALYRLGDDMVARLPLRPSATKQIDRERRWLPVLAPHLPLAIPVPLMRGEPTETYPWPWSVHPWFEGEDATTARFDRPQAARDLAGFIAALGAIDATGGPEPSAANFGRGTPLAARDRDTRQAINAARHVVETEAVTAAWEQALRAPAWDRPPVWVHGDIAAGNLLVRDGRLSAVIDWGGLGVGDPACDLVVAWELFDAQSREELRSELGIDDATWARGRGWALSTAVTALRYYEHTNAYMAAQARRKIAAVLND